MSFKRLLDDAQVPDYDRLSAPREKPNPEGDDASFHRTGCTPYISMVTACVCIGSFLFGYDTGVISGALLFIKGYYDLGPELLGLVVSATLIGSAIGSMGGWVSNRFGRRKTLSFASLLFIAGGLVMFFAPHVSVLIVGRFVVGVAIGMASIVIPVYIAEVAPEDVRGRLASTPQLMVSTGVLSSYLIDFGICLAANRHGFGDTKEFFKTPWRMMLGFSIVPAILMFLALNYVPESPRWLYLQGREQEARQVLRKIYGKKDLEFEYLLDSSNEHEEKEASLRAFLTIFKGGRPLVLRVLLIAIALQVLQQFTGINAVVYYTPCLFQTVKVETLFESIGLDFDKDSASLLATAIVYSFKIPAILTTMRVMDSWGRRTVLLIGLPIMAICLSGLAAAFRLSGNDTACASSSTSSTSGSIAGSMSGSEVVDPALSIVTAIAILFFGMSFSSSFGPIPLMFAAEVFPLDVRGQCTSIVTATNWICNVIVSQAFPSLEKNYLFQTFLTFVGVCTFAIFFIYFFMPETKGVTLEKMYQRLETERERSRKCFGC